MRAPRRSMKPIPSWSRRRSHEWSMDHWKRLEAAMAAARMIIGNDPSQGEEEEVGSKEAEDSGSD